MDDPVVGALAAQHAELDGLLSGLDGAGWARASRCPGWSVADVVLHLAQTDELALASTRGRLSDAAGPEWLAPEGGFADVDDAAARAVDRERGAPGPEVLRRWRHAAAALRAGFAAADPGTRLRWVAGELPARTLATTRLAEAWIHTGDVTDALGATAPADGRLWHIARLAWRTLPYAFAKAGRAPTGPIGLELTAPGDTHWTFAPDPPAASVTTVRGPALDFCLVAARRLDPAAGALTAEGPDAGAVLALVRTFA